MEKKGIKPSADVIKKLDKEYGHYDQLNNKLVAAIWNGNVAAVNVLIAQGAMISIGKQGITPLMKAIAIAPQQAVMPLVMILVDNGANVNAKSQLGWTPLLLAIQRHRKGNEIRIKWGQLYSPPFSSPSLNDKYILPSEAEDPVISFLVSVGAKIDF